MTQVARLYEEEKIEAVNQVLLQAEQRLHEQKRQIAFSLLESGVDILMLMKATGLTRAEIEGYQEA